MTKSATLEILSRLGPVSKMFWKSDDLLRGERLAFYIHHDEITAMRYRLTGGTPTGIVNIERVTATDLVVADAKANGDDIEVALQRLASANGRTYKMIKTFHFTTTINLLLEQSANRPDAIVVGEVADLGGEKTIFLKARIEPQHLGRTVESVN